MAKQTFTTGQVLTAAQMTSLQQTAMLGGAASAKTASYTLVAADAGSAISMSNASATTITVNTALFAAGDTVHITNLGAGVCTITAGTATVNSSASLALAQYESGFLDFTSTSAAIFVKGAGAAAAPTTPSFVGCALKVSTGQSLTNGTETTINFDQEDFDTDAFHDNVTNNSRITIPAGKAGKYAIYAKVTFPSTPSGATGYRRMSIKLNGTTYFASFQDSSAFESGAGTFNKTIQISQIIDLVATDFLTCTAQQGSTSTLTTVTGFSDRDNVFTATYLGA